ncbi:hypothetical protein CNYM01_12901 [Colletotrichum nymphaeae SA-01]|uniref:Tat pathway signal sequence n=1 Tax=Colletotrichum nymphaeae SA-01 TaxID=1460502 RepID=A0A135USN6_9PEZI|nr:hypothetical protein CNYM01_12901 [Colletotrichum nymphaeae SA-01]
MPGKWEKPFRDESDLSSEDLSLTDETLRVRRAGPRRQVWRLLGEAALAVGIIILGGIVIHDRVLPRTGLLPYGPVIPQKVVTFGNTAGFGPDLVYAHRQMLLNATRMQEVHENWQQLYPISRGYFVADENSAEYKVQFPPADISGVLSPDDKRSGWVLSVFHQIHCLSIITTRLGISRKEFADWDPFKLGHTAHCIEYLRQSILCSGDTNLEGESGSWSESIGWGQNHVCRDYDALMRLANEKAAWDLSHEREPDHSKLFESNMDDCDSEIGEYCH